MLFSQLNLLDGHDTARFLSLCGGNADKMGEHRGMRTPDAVGHLQWVLPNESRVKSASRISDKSRRPDEDSSRLAKRGRFILGGRILYV